MKNDDGLPFDRPRWLHESGPGTEPDDSHIHDPELPERGTSKTEEKRLRDLKARASQGDRTDWEDHLRWNTPPGFKVVPNSKLTHKAKTGRANSLKAAAERRSGCTRGITLHYTPWAWSKLKQADRDAHEQRKQGIAALTGVRWDYDRDFYWYGETDAAHHLDHLFRSGTREPQPKQPFLAWHREGQQA